MILKRKRAAAFIFGGLLAVSFLVTHYRFHSRNGKYLLLTASVLLQERATSLLLLLLLQLLPLEARSRQEHGTKRCNVLEVATSLRVYHK
jgi:hypothetical protein